MSLKLGTFLEQKLARVLYTWVLRCYLLQRMLPMACTSPMSVKKRRHSTLEDITSKTLPMERSLESSTELEKTTGQFSFTLSTMLKSDHLTDVTRRSIHDFTVWNIPPPSKVVPHVKTQKYHKIFSQLSATLIVQLKMCWIGPPSCCDCC